nr:ATP-binding protein [Ancylobacter crimeensis]
MDVDAQVAAVATISAIPSILEVACATTGMRFAAVACVTDTRWVACATRDELGFGMVAGDEIPIETTFCDRVRATRREVVFDDAAADPAYADDPIPKLYNITSYLSVPVVLSDGSFFGTLCALDTRPTALKDTPTVAMFRLFAQLVARHVEDRLLLHESHAQLAASREATELREQFIAVLGHDLRNPIAALQGGIRLLAREQVGAKSASILDAMRQTTGRMAALVDNLLDLARGRLAGGITVDPDGSRDITDTLEQVVAEVRAAHPERVIETTCRIDRPVPVDHQRIAQMLANLLANAATHGAPDQPIRVGAQATNGVFELSVSNGGEPIPPEALGRLFQPFYRGSRTTNHGLGLGLYIATQVAKAHGGTLDVASDSRETRFTFRMMLPPLGLAQPEAKPAEANPAEANLPAA